MQAASKLDRRDPAASDQGSQWVKRLGPAKGLAQVLVALVGGFAITWYLWGPILHAYWWIIDDYRWVTLMADRGRLTFLEMLAQFNPPDWYLGSPVNRPTYYISHAIWCFVLGNNPTLWYLARISCFGVAAVGFWYVVSRRIGNILAGLLVFYIAIQPFWVDIVPKAVSETFAAAGSTILLLGVSILLEDGRLAWRQRVSSVRTRFASVCILAGGLAAIGSKENFTVLLLGAIAGLLALSILAGHDKSIIWAYVAVLGWGSALLYFIYTGELLRGVDLYGVSIAQRKQLVSEALLRVNVPLVVAVFSLCLVGSAWIVYWRTGKVIFRDLGAVLVIAALGLYLVLARAFLYVFYNGAVVKADRYAFPYAIIPVLSFALLLMIGREVAVGVRFGDRIPKGVQIVGACILAVLVFTTDISSNRVAADHYTEGTLAFRDRLERVEAVLQTKGPSTPLLFRSFAVYDGEFLASVAKYLRVARIQNQFYLSMAYDDTPERTPTERYLITLTKGMVGPGRTFHAASELPVGTDPEVIIFSAPTPAPPALASFYPLP